jgi:hypothetical protein
MPSSLPEHRRTRHGKAVEAMAAHEGRFNKIENDLSLLKWMKGITWALCLGILFKLFLR